MSKDSTWQRPPRPAAYECNGNLLSSVSDRIDALGIQAERLHRLMPGTDLIEALQSIEDSARDVLDELDSVRRELDERASQNQQSMQRILIDPGCARGL